MGSEPHRKPLASDTARRLTRIVRGWSQEVLAELADKNRSFVGAIERAEDNVSFTSVEKLAKAFDITVAELLAQHDINHRKHSKPRVCGALVK